MRKRQARKVTTTISRPPPGSGEGAYLAWMESAARKPEWGYLHRRCTLAVLETGMETTDQDRAEAMGTQPDAVAEAQREHTKSKKPWWKAAARSKVTVGNRENQRRW